jgi:hypothetical protein
MGATMQSPSFGARSRHSRGPLHLVSSREATPRYPRPILSVSRRSSLARANRRAWWLTWVIGPGLIALVGVALVVASWRPHP